MLNSLAFVFFWRIYLFVWAIGKTNSVPKKNKLCVFDGGVMRVTFFLGVGKINGGLVLQASNIKIKKYLPATCLHLLCGWCFFFFEPILLHKML